MSLLAALMPFTYCLAEMNKQAFPEVGSKIEYMGQKWKVAMIGITGGERYVWLSRKNLVAMIPASML